MLFHLSSHGRLEAVLAATAPRHLGNIKKSKVEVLFLLNASCLHTIMKLKILSETIVSCRL